MVGALASTAFQPIIGITGVLQDWQPARFLLWKAPGSLGAGLLMRALGRRAIHFSWPPFGEHRRHETI